MADGEPVPTFDGLCAGSMILLPRHYLNNSHSAPVTSLHTSHHHSTLMWSGDAGGSIRQWCVKEFSSHWIPDENAAACRKCHSKFDMWLRKQYAPTDQQCDSPFPALTLTLLYFLCSPISQSLSTMWRCVLPRLHHQTHAIAGDGDVCSGARLRCLLRLECCTQFLYRWSIIILGIFEFVLHF